MDQEVATVLPLSISSLSHLSADVIAGISRGEGARYTNRGHRRPRYSNAIVTHGMALGDLHVKRYISRSQEHELLESVGHIPPRKVRPRVPVSLEAGEVEGMS